MNFLFFLFEWHILLPAGILFGLLVFQFLFVKRRARTLPSPRLSTDHVLQAKQSVSSENSSAGHSLPQNTETQLKPEYFQQFRENLDKNTNKSKKKNIFTALSKGRKPAKGLVDEIVVDISENAKIKPTQVKQATKSSQSIKIPQTGTPRTTYNPYSTRPSVPKALKEDRAPGSSVAVEKLFADVTSKLGSGTSNTLDSSEISAPPMASEEFNPSEFRQNSHEENKALFTEVKNLLEEKNYTQILEKISVWENDLSDSPKASESELYYIKGQAEFALEEYKIASKTWQKFLTLTASEEGVATEKLLEICDWFVLKGQHKYAMPFFLTRLNTLRREGLQSEMDLIYREITHAYKQLDDQERLIETYQSHLTIRKVLKDDEGQLEILDQLGKIYFNRGDQKGSNACYQQSIQIKQAMLDKN